MTEKTVKLTVGNEDREITKSEVEDLLATLSENNRMLKKGAKTRRRQGLPGYALTHAILTDYMKRAFTRRGRPPKKPVEEILKDTSYGGEEAPPIDT